MITDQKKINAFIRKSFLFYAKKSMVVFSRGALVLLISIIFLAMPSIMFSATPTPGDWEGTSNYGHEMSFHVSADSTQWTNFKLKAGFFGDTLYVTKTIPGPGSIDNGEFDWSNTSGTFSFSGEFTSSTTAAGTYEFNDYPIWSPSGNIYVNQSGTWTASPETSQKNDFNGDGQGDILWRNYSNGQNAVCGRGFRASRTRSAE